MPQVFFVGALILLMLGFLFATIINRHNPPVSWARKRRKFRRMWRKQHGFRRHEEPIGDNPVPFYPPFTFIPGRTWLPTERADRLFVILRRIFRSRPKARE
jgi:hypothetical protein